MRAAFRSSFHLPLLLLRSSPVISSSLSSSSSSSSSLRLIFTSTTPVRCSVSKSFSTSVPMEKQFEQFKAQLEESGGVRERIRGVVSEIEGVNRMLSSCLLLVHQSLPLSEVLNKANNHTELIKGLFAKLAEILKEGRGEYYRYHGDWRTETQSVVSMMGFLHWLETGSLLLHAQAEKKLGLDSSEFSLDVEDYLTGLCFMSNEFPRYVVNRVTAGEYDCPRKVLSFLTELHTAFRMLNLRNDFLRKKFDGMKYDLRRVEEVYYDVKIRGLAAPDSAQEQGNLTQEKAT